MKLGVNTYSWLWNETLEDTAKIVVKNGFTGIEFLVSPPQFDISSYRPGMFKTVKRILTDGGVEVLSINLPSLDINAASPFPEMRRMTLEMYKKLTDVALELESKILLVLPGKRHPLLPPDFELIFSYCVDTLSRVLEHTKFTDLTIGIETCPALFIDKIAQMKRLVEALNDKRAKIVFDAANVFSQEDPAAALREVKDDLCLVHISDTPAAKWQHSVIGTGEVNFKSFMNALKDIGYDGYVVLEIINDRGIEGVRESVRALAEQKLDFWE